MCYPESTYWCLVDCCWRNGLGTWKNSVKRLELETSSIWKKDLVFQMNAQKLDLWNKIGFVREQTAIMLANWYTNLNFHDSLWPAWCNGIVCIASLPFPQWITCLHVYTSFPYFRQKRKCPKPFENLAIPTSRQEIGISGRSASVGFLLEFHMAARVISGLWH